MTKTASGTSVPGKPGKKTGTFGALLQGAGVQAKRGITLRKPGEDTVSPDMEFANKVAEAKQEIPEVVTEWARRLVTLMTLDSELRDGDAETEARMEIERLTSGNVHDDLTDTQKMDIATIARVHFMNMVTTIPSDDDLVKEVVSMAEKFGAIRALAKEDDPAKYRGRVIKYRGKVYVSTLSPEGSSPWVGNLNTKIDDVGRSKFLASKDEAKELRSESEITVAELLAGEPGRCAITVPDTSYEDGKGAKQFSAGGIVLVESDGNVIFPVKATGKLARRFGEIIDPVSEKGFRLSAETGRPELKPLRREFSVNDVAGLVAPKEGDENGPRMPYVKKARSESEGDFGFRRKDLTRFWNALKVGVARSLQFEKGIAALKEEQAALTKDGDVHPSVFFAEGGSARTVIFTKGDWEFGDKSYRRPIFAVTRDGDGAMTFEFPERLAELYASVKVGESYESGKVPSPAREQLAKAKRILEKSAAHTEGSEETTAE